MHHSGGALQRELERFFELLDSRGPLDPPTKGAVSKARQGLDPECFRRLNRECVGLFYDQAPVKRWKGFVVKAIDGSAIILPKHHHSVREAYPAEKFGPSGSSVRHLARLGQMCDVLNEVVCDSTLTSYQGTEMDMGKELVKACRPDEDLLLLDGYYPGIPLFIDLERRGVQFCCRMRSRWLVVREFMESENQDRIVQIKLNGNYPQYGPTYTIRLIKMKDKEGKTRVFGTSLLNQEEYDRYELARLYLRRWKVEESFKTLKQRLELGDFTGTSRQAVEQDYFAKMLQISLGKILAFKVKPAHKQRKKTKPGMPSRPVKINFTYLLYRLKKLLVIAWDALNVEALIRQLISKVKKTYEASREGQHKKRKFRSKTCRMAYKHL